MSKFSRLTIRTKLILIIMGITVGVLLLASAASIGYDAHTNRQVTKDYLNALAESISSSNAKALVARDADFSQQALEKLQDQKSILFACIFDQQGRPFVAYQRDGNARTCAILPAADLTRPQFNRVAVSHQILLGDRSIGTVVLASSTNELMANLRWDIKFSLAMLIALSLAAYLLASRLQETISRPIRSLAWTAKLVSAQRDYSIRAPSVAGGEVGALIEGFNEMLEQLGRQDGELRQARGALELRVEERTAALQGEIAVREQAEGALRISEERVRLLLDSTAEAIFGQDLQGRCTLCNPATLRLLGYKEPAELLGRDMHQLMHGSHADGSSYPECDCPITHAVTHGVSAHSEDERFWRADGTSFPVEYWAHPMQRDGVVCGAVVSFLDISERLAGREALERATEAAEAANRAKSEFLANMSHEIRTPMNGILGMTELALDTPLTGEQQEYLHLVHASAESLLRIVNDILDFSKIEAGKLDLEKAEFDLRVLLDQTVKTLAARAHKKGLEITSRIAPAVPRTLVSDSGRLRQVLVNLIGNAIKFTEQGCVSLERRAGIRERRFGHAALRGTRHGNRHFAGDGQTHLRTFLAGRRLDLAAIRRDRPRPDHFQANHRAAWRTHLGGEQAGPG